ncbi:MAG: tRNA uridine-5-carboxymethylaminomethyl(34) synthesis GTPase MnmE [Bacteroidales bacterium]
MYRREVTICAPATVTGGAIAVIRLSGPDCISICSRVFFTVSGIDLNEVEANRVHFGQVKDGSEIVDEALVTVFRAPHSYTGEDSVEISLHGSSYIQSKVIQLLLKYGATVASPGEFTMRAFMNGKMDLSQAEAVADLVSSKSKSTHRLAINQMRGGFSRELKVLRNELLNFASLIELELDFGEEDVEFADRKELLEIVEKTMLITRRLVSSFSVGNAIKNGVPVVIAGKPNSGKSTLLNRLLNEERAIVSEIPGTTRDTVEDTIVIDGIEYRFIDTAGLRKTDDIIESIGIRKTHEKIAGASVVLFVDELTDDHDGLNLRIGSIRDLTAESGQKLIIVINKCDLGSVSDISRLRESLTSINSESVAFISARNNQGIDELLEILGRTIETEKLISDEIIITNSRHYEALEGILESLERVESGIINKLPGDLLSTDIRQALHHIGDLTGEITTDEILGNIFKNFCIGK